jgi:hypothetical protein
MIIFSGAGIVIGFAAAVGFGLGEYILGGFDSGAAKYLTTWGASLGAGIAAALNFALYRLSLLPKARTLIDKATGNEVVIRPTHSPFFHPNPILAVDLFGSKRVVARRRVNPKIKRPLSANPDRCRAHAI